MKNHGRLGFKMLRIDDKSYGQPILANGTLWKDAAPEPKEGVWFIAVMSDGTIISAEMDPMQSLVVADGVEIWEIEHPGPGEVLRGKRWTGTEVVEQPVEDAG